MTTSLEASSKTFAKYFSKGQPLHTNVVIKILEYGIIRILPHFCMAHMH